MSVRPYKGREGWYYIDFYPQGKKPDPVTGKVKRQQVPFKGTYEQARAVEADLRQRHRGLTESIRINQSIMELFPPFVVDYKIEHSKGTVGDLLNASKRLLPHFGRFQINSITQTLIDAYKVKRLADPVKPGATETVKPRTINRELSYLSAFITWAVEKKHAAPLPFIIKRFPKKMTRPPLPVVPSKEEIDALFAALKPEKRLHLRLMYSGGLRRKEAGTLTVERVDLANGALIILGKGNKERVVPIADPVLFEELKARVAEVKAGYLFFHQDKKTEEKTPIKDPRKALKTAAVKAGVTKRVYNHLLRHCFGTHLTGEGVDVQTLQVVMGHADIKTTTIYTQISLESAKSKMQKLFTPVVKKSAKKAPRKQQVANHP